MLAIIGWAVLILAIWLVCAFIVCGYIGPRLRYVARGHTDAEPPPFHDQIIRMTEQDAG